MMLALASSILSSCATIFNGVNPHIEIPINTVPENANVSINGKNVGQTPMVYEMKNRKPKTVTISKENYEDINTTIESKLSPKWTAISVVGGAFPGFLIPTAIDFATGSVKEIKTDSISYNLVPENKNQSIQEPLATNNTNNNINNEQENIDEQIFNPRIRIRTGTREYLLGYKSCITIKTKNGLKLASNISQIEKDYLVLAKNNTKVYYKDINSIRIFSMRRWYPIVTSYTVFSPIFWFASSKLASYNSNDCKKSIKEIKVINKYSTYNFGKDNCK